ncbi:MAG: protein-export chaperone SecB [Orrella sp.]
MAEENTAAQNTAAQNTSGQDEAAAAFNLQRVYLKDLSLEMPNAPHIFLEQASPNVEVNIGIGGQRLAETMFEATITVTVTTKIDDKVLYLIEATQGGIFEIANIPQEQFDPLLGIVCPTMLYPYLRANVADAITRTSLPPLHLTDVNFQALYQQRLAENGQTEGGNQAKADTKADAKDAAPGIILPPGATRQ